MEEVKRGCKMDITAFEARLNELLNEISDVPSSQGKKLLQLAQKVKPVKQTGPKANHLDDSFDHLRLVIKYMIFDVEATRRENSYLRKMLEGRED
jgi:hypothetical protein